MSFGERVARPRPVRLDAAVGCTHCGATVELAGPVREARCNACQTNVEIPPLAWAKLLREIDELSFQVGEGQGSGVRVDAEGVQLACAWVLSEPLCRQCDTPVPQIEPGESGQVFCQKCGAPMPTMPAPSWLRMMTHTAQQVYGAELTFDAAALDRKPRRFWIVLQGTPNVTNARREASMKLDVEEAFRNRTPKKSSPLFWIFIVLVLGSAAYLMVTTGQRTQHNVKHILDTE